MAVHLFLFGCVAQDSEIGNHEESDNGEAIDCEPLHREEQRAYRDCELQDGIGRRHHKMMVVHLVGENLIEVPAMRLEDVFTQNDAPDDSEHRIDSINGKQHDVTGFAGVENELENGKNEDISNRYCAHIAGKA